MGMIPSNLKNEIRARFKQIKSEVKKPITIYSLPQKQDCPNCLSDHTGSSVGVFDTTFVTPVEIFGQLITPQSFNRTRCPVCKNKGYLEYESSTIIYVILRWNPPAEMSNGEMIQTPGGLEGKNVVRVKADKCYYDIIRDCVNADVDGTKCELHLPPVLRHIGDVDIMTTAFFVAVGVGHTVRED